MPCYLVFFQDLQNPYYLHNIVYVLSQYYNTPGGRFLFNTWPGNSAIHMRVGEFESQSATTISDTEWNHIVLQRDEDDWFRYYINGQLDQETNQITTDIDNHNTWIGGFYQGEGNEGWFDGFIDEVQIWNRALTGEEIQERFANAAERIV